jgi:hypothetical protein
MIRVFEGQCTERPVRLLYTPKLDLPRAYVEHASVVIRDGFVEQGRKLRLVTSVATVGAHHNKLAVHV